MERNIPAMRNRRHLLTAAFCLPLLLVVACADTDAIQIPPEAKTTASGLKYLDLKVGEGAEAKKGSPIKAHYTGMLQKNGKKFDSSVDRGETFTFTLGQKEVIQGWDEGVAGMKEGGKRLLFIPSKLGYGERGAGRSIPPGSDLYFEVELIKVR